MKLTCTPEGKGNEQAAGTTIQQTPTNLHVERSTDCATDTDELDMPGLEFSVSKVVANLDADITAIAVVCSSGGSLFFLRGEAVVVLEGCDHGLLPGSSAGMFDVVVLLRGPDARCDRRLTELSTPIHGWDA